MSARLISSWASAKPAGFVISIATDVLFRFTDSK